MPKINSQKGSVQISTFAGMAIIAAVVVIVSAIAVIKYREVKDIAPVAAIAPKVTPVVKPISSPVIDVKIEDWQTYTNEEYGFEIKYPPVWSYNDGPLPYTFYFGNSGPYEYQVGVWVTPTSNINKTDEQCKTIVLAGKSGWRCEGEQWSDTEHGVKTGYMVKHIYIEVENYGKFYYFSVAASEQNATDRFNFFNQMLSTFKFTGINETADWKTYDNDKYGFEVKYPKNWEAIESTTPGSLYLAYVTFGLSETIQEGGSFGLAIRNQTENEYKNFLKKEGVTVNNGVDTIIGGKKATRYILDGRVDDIVVLGDNFLLTFENGNMTQKSIFDQMLSSIKFTTSNEAER